MKNSIDENKTLRNRFPASPALYKLRSVFAMFISNMKRLPSRVSAYFRQIYKGVKRIFRIPTWKMAGFSLAGEPVDHRTVYWKP